MVIRFLAPALALALVSCADPPREAPLVPVGPDPRSWELSDVEKGWIEAHRSAGLRVASTELEGSFKQTKDGPVGFQVELAKAFGEFLGLKVTVTPVTFNTYFARDGAVPPEVVTDPELRYVPDVFRDHDIAAFLLTAIPWREKLMTFHGIFESRVVLVTLRGKELTQLSDLAHHKILVIENTTHQSVMKTLQSHLGVPFEIVLAPYESDLMQMLREGRADALVRDAYSSMMVLQKNRDFNVTLPLTSTEKINWAVAKKSEVLGGLIEKFLIKFRSTGAMAALWENAHGLSFDAYANLIGSDPPLRWTAEEKAVIDTLAATGLRVAVNPAPGVYEPRAGGPRGITYNLLLEVARRLNVPLKLRTVDFRDYFDKNGRFPEQAETDASFTYRPDLLDKVDVYADTLNPLEWRRKFLGFVGLYPSRLVWLTRNPQAPGEGARIAVSGAGEEWLRAHPVAGAKLLVTKSADESLRRVAEGGADFALGEANLALSWLSRYSDLRFLPAGSPVEELSWAVDKDREALRGILEKCLESIRASGTLGRIWQNYYRVPLEEYLSLIAVQNP